MSDQRAHVEYYQDAAGEWRWRVVAANGQIVGVPGEGYTRKADAERGFGDHVSAIGQIVLYRGGSLG